MVKESASEESTKMITRGEEGKGCPVRPNVPLVG